MHNAEKKNPQEQLMQQLDKHTKRKPRTYDLAICVTSKRMHMVHRILEDLKHAHFSLPKITLKLVKSLVEYG